MISNSFLVGYRTTDPRRVGSDCTSSFNEPKIKRAAVANNEVPITKKRG